MAGEAVAWKGWPASGVSKEEMLPVEVTEFGHVQRSTFRNVDRLDEEVIELDGPHSMVVAAGTEVVSFVLLGDQNAGKSTYLHSFGYNHDDNFLEMMSLLPVLSSSFINTRFLTKDDPRPAMDEPPFIDTDLARSTLSLTLDDFAFWVAERDLDLSLVTSLPAGTRFVVIQFIEFGGDHLDQIMSPELSKDQTTRDIVARSRAMLTACRKVVYFVNAETLLHSAGAAAMDMDIDIDAAGGVTETDSSAGGLGGTPTGCGEIGGTPSLGDVRSCAPTVSIECLRLLCTRLQFLDTLFAPGMELMVVVSRGRGRSVTSAQVSEALAMLGDVTGGAPETGVAQNASGSLGGTSAAVGTDGDTADIQNVGRPPTVTVETLLEILLARLASTQAFSLRIGRRVVCGNHLDDAGDLNPEGINQTLAAMFSQDMVNATGSPGTFVAGHLLECFKQPLLRLDADDTFSIYVNRDIFQEYLEDLDGALEAPDTVLLQHYAPTARQTVEIGMALQHHADSLSRFLLVVECSPRDGAGAAGGSVCYATPDPPVADVDATGGNRGGGAIPIIVGGVLQGQEDGDIEIRFPYHTELFNLVNSYFARNVPPELWLDQSWLAEGVDAGGRAELGRVYSALVTAVESTLAAVITGASARVDDAAGHRRAGTDGDGAVHNTDAVRRWLWLVEDLSLAHRLLYRHGAVPLKLNVRQHDEGSIATLHRILSTVLQKVPATSIAAYPTQIVLGCTPTP